MSAKLLNRIAFETKSIHLVLFFIGNLIIWFKDV